MRLHLEPAILERRYQRFLADVIRPDGSRLTVHVPNTGSMATLHNPGCAAWLRLATNPARKLAYTLSLVGTPGGGLSIIDTGLPNGLAFEAVCAGTIPELAGYAGIRREVRYGSRGSRIDLLLTGHATRPDCWVEVKNVTMLGAPGRADFPDAVTERGLKHLEELSDVVADGMRGVQLYLIDRTDCRAAGIAHGFDPAYGAMAKRAALAGVEFLAYRLRVRRRGGVFDLSLTGPCPVSGLV